VLLRLSAVKVLPPLFDAPPVAVVSPTLPPKPLKISASGF